MPKLLNAGCGTHYAHGWINTDTATYPGCTPDVLTEPDQPYPFDADTFDAIYLGHILEHMDWATTPTFLADMSRIAKPGAPILVTGPDIYRTISGWRDGRESWELVISTLEHQSTISPVGQREAEPFGHHWNCHEDRLIHLLEGCGFVNVQPVTELISANWKPSVWRVSDRRWPVQEVKWPIVNWSRWQCAVWGENP